MLPQFFILHRRWGLALGCLDRVLARPKDEEEEWRPCAESLLLRARVRLATADTAGALHDAQFVADTTRDNEGRAARAMVLKAQVLILFVPITGKLGKIIASFENLKQVWPQNNISWSLCMYAN